MSNMSILMNKPHLATELEIWTPKYSTQYGNEGEWVVKLSKRKVDFAQSAVIKIKFTKAKHLMGQRYAMYRKDIIKYPLGTNGTIPVYEVPMSALCYWESVDNIKKTADELFPSKEG